MGWTRVALLAATLGVPLGAPAACETNYTQYASLAYAPLGGEPGCLAGGLLSSPPGWTAGDAAALVLTRRELVDVRRDGMVAALLSEGSAVLEIIAGAATDCGGPAASDTADEVLAALAALHEHGARSVVVLGFDEDARTTLGAGIVSGAGCDLIAFCRPRAWAAEPCFCSSETAEVPTTSAQVVLHTREQRTTEARSADELRAAVRRAGEVCGEGVASVSAEAPGQNQAPGSPPARMSVGVERLTITPVQLPSGAPAPAGLLPGLLAMPPGWLHGAGVVVLTWDGLDPISGRDSLVSGLLDAGLAVLELDLATSRGFSADSNRTPPEPTVEDFVADLLAVASALQRDHGAGAVAALGHGQGGEAALHAAARGGSSAGARLSPRGSVATAGEGDQPDRRAAAARLCNAITAAAPEYWPATACAGGHHCSCAVMP